jgi:hypothetical protein
MNEVIIDFLMGTTLSSVPIYVLTKYYFENNLTSKDYDYKSVIMYMPIQMGAINAILFLIARRFFPEFANNAVIMGAFMSIILSMLSSSNSMSFHDIPNKVIKMHNPNMFHIYSVIIFIILYFILLNAKNKLVLK